MDRLAQLREEYKAALLTFRASGQRIQNLESEILCVRERMHLERAECDRLHRVLMEEFAGWREGT